MINGRAVYKADGSLKCANTEIPQGFAGVGNFDGDPAAEIVVAGYGKVSLLDDDCSLLWTRDVHYTDPVGPSPRAATAARPTSRTSTATGSRRLASRAAGTTPSTRPTAR